MAISVGTDPDLALKTRKGTGRYKVSGTGVCTVLLQIAKAERRPVWVPVGLRGDAEDCVDELALRDSVALGEPSDLTFADCMHRLVALDRSAGALHRSKAEARRDPLLYEADGDCRRTARTTAGLPMDS